MIRARLHPVPLVAGLAVALLTLQLGNWQVRRAAEKTALHARIEAGAASATVSPAGDDVTEWRTVALRGEWLAAATIYLDNRVHEGRVGYQVLTPLRLDDGSGAVLVNRGWTAGGADRRELPRIATSSGPVEVAGSVRRPEAHPFTLADEAGRGQVWQYLDLGRYRETSGLPVRDWIVQQTSAAADGLVRDWPRPDAGIDRHRGYAFQWYALAGLSIVLTGAYVYRRLRT